MESNNNKSITFEEGGVLLKDAVRDKRVFLKMHAWATLSALQHEISQAVHEKSEEVWMLDEGTNQRAHTVPYQGKWYLHLRHWVNEHPTKNGVALYLPNDWDWLKRQLKTDEMELAVKVMKKLVKDNVSRRISKTCDGCLHDWPSQLDHECLQPGQTKAEVHLEKAIRDVKPPHFIISLAEAVRDASLILEAPHHAYQTVKDSYMKEVKDAVLKDYEL